MHPRQGDDQDLAAAEVGRQRPQREGDPRVGVLDAVELPRQAGADDVRDQQRWDRQAERQLRGLPERHPERAALVEGPECQRHVRRQCRIEHERSEWTAPEREKIDAPRFHRLERDETQRVVRQVRRHVGEQDEAGGEPHAACREHDKNPGGLYRNERAAGRQDRNRDGRGIAWPGRRQRQGHRHPHGTRGRARALRGRAEGPRRGNGRAHPRRAR